MIFFFFLYTLLGVYIKMSYQYIERVGLFVVVLIGVLLLLELARSP